MSLKQPPTFDQSRGDCYQDWKADVEIWGAYTKDEKGRRGPAVYLSLQGEAREAVRSLKVADLSNVMALQNYWVSWTKCILKRKQQEHFVQSNHL